MEVMLKISRFNPESDQKPYFQEFTVAAQGRQTVLDALLLAREQDPRDCHSAARAAALFVVPAPSA